MEQFKSVTRFEIEKKLTSGHLRINRIISLALCAGSFLFLVIILFLYQKKTITQPELESISLIHNLCLVFILLAVVVYSTFLLLPKIFLKQESLKKQLLGAEYDQNINKIDDPALRLISLDRTLMIIRLAQLEGVTLFGLVVLMLSVQNGYIYVNNALWLLTLPLFVMLGFTLTNYITKEKTIMRIENNILATIKQF